MVELIDPLIPQEKEKRKVSIGPGVKAMVLNGLGFANRALYLSSLFFGDKPTERLIGEGIEAQHLNDDRLWRVLDGIAKWLQKSSKIWVWRADSAIWTRPGFIPMANTTAMKRRNKGYSRDQRPELNPVVLRQAGIPLLMQS